MNILEAKVIAVDTLHVCIICPICGQIHRHGSNKDFSQQDYGHRLSHCTDIQLPWANGLFPTNPRGDSYNLICTPETARFDDNGKADAFANVWYKKTLAKSFNEARHNLATEAKQAAKANCPWTSRTTRIDLSEYVKTALMTRSLAERMGL